MRIEKGKFAMVTIEAIDGEKPHVQTVYMRVCGYANSDGICFPSVKELASKSGISENHARDAISRLVEIGLLSKRNRIRENGSQTSNEYEVFTERGEASEHSEPPLHDVNPPPPQYAPPPSTICTPITIPSNQTKVTISSPSEKEMTGTVVDFEKSEKTKRIDDIVEFMAETLREKGFVYRPDGKERWYGNTIFRAKIIDETAKLYKMTVEEFFASILITSLAIPFWKGKVYNLKLWHKHWAAVLNDGRKLKNEKEERRSKCQI